MLILYPTTLLNLLISLKDILVESFGIFIYKNISPVINNRLIPAQIGCFLFPWPAYLLCLGLLVLCWSGVIRVGPTVLFLGLEEKFQSFIVEYHVICGFTIYCLYYVEVCFFCTQFVDSFSYEMMLYFVKYFSCTCWNDHMIFVFHCI